MLIFDDSSEEVPQPLMANPDYVVPETLPAAEGEEEAEEEELEEEVPPLNGIDQDPPVATYGEEEGAELPAWSTKMCSTEFGAYGVAIAKSNRWPGAYAAIAKGVDKSACVYFGWGQEQMGKNFTLEPFPTIAAESAEAAEADEVTVENENAVLQEIDEAKLAAANADEGDEE